MFNKDIPVMTATELFMVQNGKCPHCGNSLVVVATVELDSRQCTYCGKVYVIDLKVTEDG